MTTTSTQTGHPTHPAQRVSWATHLLGAALYTVGTYGMLGGYPSPLSDLGLGLGVLILAIGTIIVARTQIRHHGRGSSLPAIGGPRSLLSGWMAGGPLLFHVLLPESTPLSVIVLLSLLLGTVFYVVFRLEDAELTAQAAPKPARRTK